MKNLAKNEEDNDEEPTPKWLFILFIAGFAVLLIGILVVFAAATFGNSGSASSAVVIFIGPFPIVLGAGPNADLLILIGIVIAVASAVLFFVLRRRFVWEKV